MKNILKERFIKMVDALLESKKDLKKADLASKMGISGPAFSNHLNINRPTPQIFIDDFINKFNLNRDYYETGAGDPLTKSVNDAEKKTTPRLEAKPLYLASDPNDYDNDGTKFEHFGDGRIRMRIKVVAGQKARAGYLRGFQDPEYLESLQNTISIDVEKEFRGHYLGFEIEGDSMTTTDPEQFHLLALPGWIAVARELPHHHWKNKLHINKIKHWVIIHETEGIIIKNITHHDVDAGTITIHSANPNYADEVLHLKDVAQLWAVHNFWVKS